MSDYLKTPGFCVAPFVHSCIWTDGRAIPCCINQDVIFGDAKTENLEKIYSNDNETLRSFRQDLLNGKTPSSCYRCTNPERDLGAESYRMFLNQRYGHVLDNMTIHPDGKVDHQKFAYYDVRFSNLCTLKCRMCDHINSSAIAAEENTHEGKKNKVLTEPFENFEEFSKFFVKNIDSVENMYFCGGEPLILEYHYKLLQLLIDHGKTDVLLKYNSNCTSIRFRHHEITEYWKKFSNVCVGMSLDDTGPRGEFIRDGSKWDVIKNNLQQIRKECPHVWLEWTPTVQIMNVMTVPELHMELIRESLVDAWYYIILTDPDYFSIQVLPAALKGKVSEIWEQHAIFLQRLHIPMAKLKSATEVINFMNLEDRTKLLPKFRDEIRKKDRIRNQSFVKVFPDLKQLMEN